MFGGYLPLMNDGQFSFRPVYVGDVARGLGRLAELEHLPLESTSESDAGSVVRPRVHAYQGPDVYTYRQLVELFCNIARKPFHPLSVPYPLYRWIVSWSQRQPLARLSVHDCDWWSAQERVGPLAVAGAPTKAKGQTAEGEGMVSLGEVGVDAQRLDALMVRFVRHYRSEKWVDEPASLAEVRSVPKEEV